MPWELFFFFFFAPPLLRVLATTAFDGQGQPYLELGIESKKFYVLSINVSIDEDQKKTSPGFQLPLCHFSG